MKKTKEIKLRIKELKKDKCSTYRNDAVDMENVLLNLKNKNYDKAEEIYSKMDTCVRDDFLDKMTNNCKDKKAMIYLSDKLGFEWIGNTKNYLDGQKQENKSEETIEERAAKILNTWSKVDLINDILELTSKEGLKEFVEQNELN